MATALATIAPADLASDTADFEAALEEAFGVRFLMWPIRDAEKCHQQAAQLPEACTDLALETVMSAAADKQPAMVAADSDAWLLAIPRVTRGATGLVASALIESSSPDRLQSHARLFVENFRIAEENLELTRLSDALAVQVSQDFEELVFLRGTTDHLRLHSQSRNPLDMVNAVIPVLRETLKVESVAFVHSQLGADADPGPGTRRDLDVIWSGPQILDHGQCTELVQALGDQATERPFILNDAKESELQVDFPEIQELLLATVGRGDAASWLLAINRVGRRSGPQYAWRVSEQRFGSVEVTLLASAASILATHFHNVELLKDGELLFTEIIKALINAMEARDPYTRGHSERVARYCRLLGKAYGLDTEACESLHLAGLLHDVGKIAISDVVLQKPDGLTDAEFAELKRHPGEGRAILQDLKHLQNIMSGVYYHHERFDGKGYPCGLAGEDIPLEGRIMSVCDAYDAMTSNRPYRQAITQENAEAILREGAGTQWDAQLIELFLSIMPDILRAGQLNLTDGTASADRRTTYSRRV